jgi:nucleotide-binding universal stress UspA family protein
VENREEKHMSNWKRYLVGIDGSDPAKEALRCALEMAGRFGGTVTLINVVDQEKVTGQMITPGMPYAPIDIKPLDYYRELQETLVENGKKALDDAGRIAAQTGVEWVSKQTMGLPGDVLSRMAKSHDALFLGERGLTDLVEKGLGKEVLNVARHCPRPVMVVEKFHKFGKVLLAYDGSPEAAKALKVAVDFTGKHGYEFHLLTVSEPQRAGETTLAEAKEYLGAHGVNVEYHLREGEPAETILKSAAEFGCGFIMMGAFGHRTFHDMVFGSTAERVLNESNRPVLLAK